MIANSGLGLSEKGGVNLAGIWISSLYVIGSKKFSNKMSQKMGQQNLTSKSDVARDPLGISSACVQEPTIISRKARRGNGRIHGRIVCGGIAG